MAKIIIKEKRDSKRAIIIISFNYCGGVGLVKCLSFIRALVQFNLIFFFLKKKN
jgi:hypothetical protein